MKQATTDMLSNVSTTDLMTYDGEYKTDFDKFRDMSGASQAAIIGCGIVAVGAIGYAIYKGYKHYEANKTQKNDINTQYYYPQQQYQLPNFNINGQYTPAPEGGNPSLAIQANMQQPIQPIQPQVAPQPQMIQPNQYQQIQQPIYTQKVSDPNGNVNIVPVNYAVS